ncbi:recombinase family protein [Siphonobacter sp. SORGH_AS_1065]|uniref:recombinase family protein n=1 Tax=Siphonobacter sp. SORGH_AS_1065 TaxID=3041795 RepID=UPI00277FF455|nr:recombinase family protein [Siphonobacter sp. SORGH_AS_1065]MDQ1086151.1 DNA invertase Pin-like site-specific DNA recombinase [Siphonobacter sp. SORGH_AS_1065]
MKETIAYYRVSTQRQGRSGLGLEAQQAAIAQYCQFHDYELVDEVMEVQSTRKLQSRLLEALEQCKLLNASLMVARLDRLGRDVEKIAQLIKSDVEIIVTDNPHATRFTIHILAAVAEEQRQRISETTKEALEAARKRGVMLGQNGKRLAKQNKRAAQAFARQMFPLIQKLRSQGIRTLRGIADELNIQGVPTFRGNAHWHASTVFVLLHRLHK